MAYEPSIQAINAFGADKVDTIRGWFGDYVSENTARDLDAILTHLRLLQPDVKNNILSDRVLEGFIKTHGKSDKRATPSMSAIYELEHALREVTKSPDFSAEKLNQIICLMHLSVKHGISSGANYFLFGYNQDQDNLDELLQDRLEEINTARKEENDDLEDLELDNLAAIETELKNSLRQAQEQRQARHHRPKVLIKPEEIQKLKTFFDNDRTKYKVDADQHGSTLVFEKNPITNVFDKPFLSVSENEIEIRKSIAEMTADDYVIAFKAGLETFSSLVVFLPNDDEKAKAEEAIARLKRDDDYKTRIKDHCMLTTDETVYQQKQEELKNEPESDESARVTGRRQGLTVSPAVENDEENVVVQEEEEEQDEDEEQEHGHQHEDEEQDEEEVDDELESEQSISSIPRASQSTQNLISQLQRQTHNLASSSSGASASHGQQSTSSHQPSGKSQASNLNNLFGNSSSHSPSASSSVSQNQSDDGAPTPDQNPIWRPRPGK